MRRESATQVFERLRVAWPGRNIFLGIKEIPPTDDKPLVAQFIYTVGFMVRIEGHNHAQIITGRSWSDAADKALLHPENDAKPTHGLCQCGNDFPLRLSGRGNQPKFCPACIGERARERSRLNAQNRQGKD